MIFLLMNLNLTAELSIVGDLTYTHTHIHVYIKKKYETLYIRRPRRAARNLQGVITYFIYGQGRTKGEYEYVTHFAD